MTTDEILAAITAEIAKMDAEAAEATRKPTEQDLIGYVMDAAGWAFQEHAKGDAELARWQLVRCAARAIIAARNI